MPDVLTSSSTAFRRRRRTGSTQLLRSGGYDIGYLLHNSNSNTNNNNSHDHKNKSDNNNNIYNNNNNDIRRTSTESKKFLRWTACFAFVTKFKRSKSEKLDFISEIDPHSRRHSNNENGCPSNNLVAQHQDKKSDYLQPPQQQHNHRLLRRPFSQCLERITSIDPDQDSIASTLFQWKEGTTPLPISSLSPLSPPPRHTMKERSKSLSIEDTTTAPEIVSSLPVPRKRKGTTISRSLALRLSLDVDQHYSSSYSSGVTHSSSGISNGPHTDFLKKGELDDEDDTTSSISSQQVYRNSGINHSNSNNNSLSVNDNNYDHSNYQKLRLSSIEIPISSSSSSDLKNDQSLQQQRRHHGTSPLIITQVNTSKDQQEEEHNSKEQATIPNNNNSEDDGSDYSDLIKEFQLPSEKLPCQKQQEQGRAQQQNTNINNNSMIATIATASSTTIVDIQKNKEITKEEVLNIHPLDNTHCIIQDNSNGSSSSNTGYNTPTPFVSRSTITANELSRQKAMGALEDHFGKFGFSGSKSMDIVRDKAQYDAVVAGTMHRRPWTHYLRAQSEPKVQLQRQKGEKEFNHSQQQDQQMKMNKKPLISQQKESTSTPPANARSGNHSGVFVDYNSKLHRPSLVFYPPSPNSIHSNH
ncbi:hypothetical protein BDC45DRAFT_608588 [Circinella umbellata]|nr:hypothetical protein BDC45DRAFT_608588 [Circinella umbellata]